MAGFLRFLNTVKNNRSIYAHSKRTCSLLNHSATKNGQLRQVSALVPQTEPIRLYSSAKLNENTVNDQSDQTGSGGQVQKHQFQAETRMLLDIVARSLYSETEVFLRELISNASDALEKFRYTVHTAGELEKEYEKTDRALEIHIETSKSDQILTIQDTGIGMTKDELVNNLGTIARSGSKQFLDEVKKSGGSIENSQNIIGQFGVGFYSAFMVADKVDVYTRSSKIGSPGLRWTSRGDGTYEIEEVNDVEVGTKIVMHLKTDYRGYADETRVKDIIKKYSNFVGSPIYLNKIQVNDIKPVWLLEPKEVTNEQHLEFYRYISNSYDKPQYILHYKTDVPLSIRALLYVPETKPSYIDMSRNTESGVALYTRKILIQSKCDQLLPKWLRFVKGVVDSEDIPLNLSRELLQNNVLIRKLQTVLKNRFLRFLQEGARKKPEDYLAFYEGYSLFLKEGVLVTENQNEKEKIATLLRFETSILSGSSQKISLAQYVQQMPPDQKEIFYLAAPNRQLAENSPYFEAMQSNNVEVLFCYEPYDEVVLIQLGSFMGKSIVSAEKEMRDDKKGDNQADLGADSLLRTQIDEMIPWMQTILQGKATNIKITTKLVEHPCAITVDDMGAARHFLRTKLHSVPEDMHYALLQPQLEVNPKHPIIKKLYKLKSSDPELGTLLTKQLFDNAMVAAGLCDDARALLITMNNLLSKVLEKH